MKGCSEGCIELAVCDFCKYYNFNGNKNGTYIELGYCTLYKTKKHPESDICKRFYCKEIDNPSKKESWMTNESAV